jgi:NAD(P)-dependent dehydrogenase (short-subunit alcohol dehydrogenase family)
MAPLAVVTGGNRGIGLEVCRQLAARGFDVVMGSRDPERGRATGLDVDVRQLDVADPASIAALRLERCDVLVNNAAIDYDTWQRAGSADLRVVEEALEVNLLGAWRMTQALLPLLRRSAHGRIVNVSSGAGSITTMTGGPPAYSVSKAALNALTRLLAADLRPILVNAVCPGWVATDMGGPGGRPVAEGAAGIVWAATLPDDGPTGGFFRDGRPIAW